MTSPPVANILVAVVTRDPYFLFAARALLGRSRRIRIRGVYAGVAAFAAEHAAAHVAAAAVLCDLDSTDHAPDLLAALEQVTAPAAGLSVLCLAEADLAGRVAALEHLPLGALLSKRDLGYCLHLAIAAAVRRRCTLVTESVRSLLRPDSYLSRHAKTIGPHKEHPALPARLAEILMWRVFVGLDNPDIQDELLLEHDTVRAYVSRAYKALGVTSELGAFEALSDWWWLSRFGEVDRG